MDEPLYVDARGLADLLRPATLDDQPSALTDLPIVVVNLDGDTPESASTSLPTETLSGLPCVFVGLAAPPLSASATRISSRLDLLIADGNTGLLEEVVQAVRMNPLAAVSLALLLRQELYERPVGGLVAESASYSALQAGPEFARWLAARSSHAPAQDGERVIVRREGATLHLVLARPERRNAVDAKMRDALHEALLLALAQPELRVVLSGSGPAFCSGGDLAEFGSATDPARAHIVRLTHSLARLLLQVGTRTEARVHGACIGAGIELPAFAGRVVGQRDAFFGLPELEMGLIPGAGGTVSLPRRIGRQRTLLLALSRRRIDAPTALRWGLVDAIAERD
jgi:hypothetical protein